VKNFRGLLFCHTLSWIWSECDL